eukprot:gene8961-910_t
MTSENKEINKESTTIIEPKENKEENTNHKFDFLKLDLDQMNSKTNLDIDRSQSARPRIKSPRNFMNLVSPRKQDVTTSPREEVTHFLSKRKDLNHLVKDKNIKIPIDETEDAMLIEHTNQDILTSPRDNILKKRQQRKSMEVTKNFQLLNSQ